MSTMYVGEEAQVEERSKEVIRTVIEMEALMHLIHDGELTHYEHPIPPDAGGITLCGRRVEATRVYATPVTCGNCVTTHTVMSRRPGRRISRKYKP